MKEPLTLEPLNVIIGANASGKSNLLEAINVLRSAPGTLVLPFNMGGGAGAWIWKGQKDKPYAVIDATFDYPDHEPLRYYLAFEGIEDRFGIYEERIENEHVETPNEENIFYGYANQATWFKVNERIRVRDSSSGKISWERQFDDREFNNESSLKKFTDSERYPEISYLGCKLALIRRFGDWDTSPEGFLRRPQSPGGQTHFLEENARNLNLILTNLPRQLRPEIDKHLERFYGSFEFIDTNIGESGHIHLLAKEKDFEESIKAARLSDGTLRFLALVIILCHPTPPPLICIEEPELGLHPDILPSLAELMVEASKRSQLIVTTHSEAFLAGLSRYPEAVLVCERDRHGTHLRNLPNERLKKWLEEYTLGDLWRSGALGGNRW